MCAITGILKLENYSMDPSDIMQMVSALTHRGPDDSSYALFEKGAVSLGHARLSIVDLGTGQQPLFNENETVSLVCNGEIYDYLALRKDLETKGHSFRTHSDSEVLIHLWEEYGYSFFDHFDGEFAFLLWDSKNKTFIAARDRAGIKPLYLYKDRYEIIFASEIKAILSLDRISVGFNSDYLEMIGGGIYDLHDTLFTGVTSLRPASFIAIQDKIIQNEKQYWSNDYSVSNISYSDAQDELLVRLRRAVNRRLVADVDVGLYLSSGLDSSFICALAAESSSVSNAYHISFAGNGIYDEAPLAQKIAEHYGMHFNLLTVDKDNLADDLHQTLWHTEMPIWNLHSVAKLQLSRFVHERETKVCLTGEGSDECFAGYPYFKLEALKQQQSASSAVPQNYELLFSQFKASEASSEGILWSDWNTWSLFEGNGGLPSYHLTRAMSNLSINGKLYGRKGKSKEKILNNLDAILASATNAKNSPLNISRKISCDVMHQYIIPSLGDRVEMANSVECRTPFLDREILEFSASLPKDFLIDLNTLSEKKILRETGNRLLPSFVHRENKKPFLSPDWHNFSKTSKGNSLFAEYLSIETLGKRTIFNPEFVNYLYLMWQKAEHTARNKNLDLLMGMILSVQILGDLYLDQRPGIKSGKLIHDRTLEKERTK